MNKKELTLYSIFFVLGMIVMYYVKDANTDCFVKFTRADGETHILVGISK
jgi:hypothetical protein